MDPFGNPGHGSNGAFPFAKVMGFTCAWRLCPAKHCRSLAGAWASAQSVLNCWTSSNQKKPQAASLSPPPVPVTPSFDARHRLALAVLTLFSQNGGAKSQSQGFSVATWFGIAATAALCTPTAFAEAPKPEGEISIAAPAVLQAWEDLHCPSFSEKLLQFLSCAQSHAWQIGVRDDGLSAANKVQSGFASPEHQRDTEASHLALQAQPSLLDDVQPTTLAARSFDAPVASRHALLDSRKTQHGFKTRTFAMAAEMHNESENIEVTSLTVAAAVPPADYFHLSGASDACAKSGADGSVVAVENVSLPKYDNNSSGCVDAPSSPAEWPILPSSAAVNECQMQEAWSLLSTAAGQLWQRHGACNAEHSIQQDPVSDLNSAMVRMPSELLDASCDAARSSGNCHGAAPPHAAPGNDVITSATGDGSTVPALSVGHGQCRRSARGSTLNVLACSIAGCGPSCSAAPLTTILEEGAADTLKKCLTTPVTAHDASVQATNLVLLHDVAGLHPVIDIPLSVEPCFQPHQGHLVQLPVAAATIPLVASSPKDAHCAGQAAEQQIKQLFDQQMEQRVEEQVEQQVEHPVVTVVKTTTHNVLLPAASSSSTELASSAEVPHVCHQILRSEDLSLHLTRELKADCATEATLHVDLQSHTNNLNAVGFAQFLQWRQQFLGNQGLDVTLAVLGVAGLDETSGHDISKTESVLRLDALPKVLQALEFDIHELLSQANGIKEGLRHFTNRPPADSWEVAESHLETLDEFFRKSCIILGRVPPCSDSSRSQVFQLVVPPLVQCGRVCSAGLAALLAQRAAGGHLRGADIGDQLELVHRFVHLVAQITQELREAEVLVPDCEYSRELGSAVHEVFAALAGSASRLQASAISGLVHASASRSSSAGLDRVMAMTRMWRESHKLRMLITTVWPELQTPILRQMAECHKNAVESFARLLKGPQQQQRKKGGPHGSAPQVGSQASTSAAQQSTAGEEFVWSEKAGVSSDEVARLKRVLDLLWNLLHYSKATFKELLQQTPDKADKRRYASIQEGCFEVCLALARRASRWSGPRLRSVSGSLVDEVKRCQSDILRFVVEWDKSCLGAPGHKQMAMLQEITFRLVKQYMALQRQSSSRDSLSTAITDHSSLQPLFPPPAAPTPTSPYRNPFTQPDTPSNLYPAQNAAPNTHQLNPTPAMSPSAHQGAHRPLPYSPATNIASASSSALHTPPATPSALASPFAPQAVPPLWGGLSPMRGAGTPQHSAFVPLPLAPTAGNPFAMAAALGQGPPLHHMPQIPENRQPVPLQPAAQRPQVPVNMQTSLMSTQPALPAQTLPQGNQTSMPLPTVAPAPYTSIASPFAAPAQTPIQPTSAFAQSPFARIPHSQPLISVPNANPPAPQTPDPTVPSAPQQPSNQQQDHSPFNDLALHSRLQSVVECFTPSRSTSGSSAHLPTTLPSPYSPPSPAAPLEASALVGTQSASPPAGNMAGAEPLTSQLSDTGDHNPGRELHSRGRHRQGVGHTPGRGDLTKNRGKQVMDSHSSLSGIEYGSLDSTRGNGGRCNNDGSQGSVRGGVITVTAGPEGHRGLHEDSQAPDMGLSGQGALPAGRANVVSPVGTPVAMGTLGLADVFLQESGRGGLTDSLSGCPSSSFDDFWGVKWEEVLGANVREWFTGKTRLGRGSYGEVYKACYYHSDVAVKVLPVRAATLQTVKQEIDVLRRTRHPNVVRFLGACMEPVPQGHGAKPARHLAIVMELCDIGTLHATISKARHLATRKRDPRVMHFHSSWTTRLDIARGIAAGTAFLHSRNVVHRDLTSYNVLLHYGVPWQAKVADFGLARDVTGHGELNNSGDLHSPGWRAPELLIPNAQYTSKADVYSFGVILWELLTLRQPWEEEFDKASQAGPRGNLPLFIKNEVIAGARLPFPDPEELGADLPEMSQVVNLAEKCWQHNPNDRPTMEQVVRRLEKIISKVKSRRK